MAVVGTEEEVDDVVSEETTAADYENGAEDGLAVFVVEGGHFWFLVWERWWRCELRLRGICCRYWNSGVDVASGTIWGLDWLTGKLCKQEHFQALSAQTTSSLYFRGCILVNLF